MKLKWTRKSGRYWREYQFGPWSIVKPSPHAAGWQLRFHDMPVGSFATRAAAEEPVLKELA